MLVSASSPAILGGFGLRVLLLDAIVPSLSDLGFLWKGRGPLFSFGKKGKRRKGEELKGIPIPGEGKGGGRAWEGGWTFHGDGAVPGHPVRSRASSGESDYVQKVI